MQKEMKVSHATDMSAGRVGDTALPTAAHRALQPIIGKWITRGLTIATAENPPMEISASDIYEWTPGGYFIVHSAYGFIGEVGVGATELIGYDKDNKNYRTWFFDNQGNTEQQVLTVRGNKWTWTGEKTRCIGIIGDDGKTMQAHHERTDDGKTWMGTMDVTLTKA
jgi:hypothetical protein